MKAHRTLDGRSIEYRKSRRMRKVRYVTHKRAGSTTLLTVEIEGLGYHTDAWVGNDLKHVMRQARRGYRLRFGARVVEYLSEFRSSKRKALTHAKRRRTVSRRSQRLVG